MNIVKSFVAACLTAAALLGPAHAVLIVDQENVEPLGGGAFFVGRASGTDFQRAQTFTVGVTGTLTQVGLQIFDTGFNTANLAVHILSVVGGVPNPAGVLASAVLTPVMVPTLDLTDPVPLTNVSLGAGIAVTAGDVLAIALSAPGSTFGSEYMWSANGINAYAGGDLYGRPDLGASTFALLDFFGASPVDVGFRTFVETGVTRVPEPSSLALFALALLLASVGRACTMPRAARR